MTRLPLRLASAAVGVALLAGTPLAWRLAEPAAEAGVVPDGGRTETRSAPAAPTTPGPDRAPRARDRAPVPVAAASLDGLGIVARPAPTRLRIPAVGIDAEVVRVGQSAPGVLEVPSDVATVGWYEPGVIPGQPGSAVIAGHVDSRTQGKGAFFALRRAEIGDIIGLVDEAGETHAWRVVARRSHPKDELPSASLFDREGGPRLALITCGGPFDAAAGRYEHNVVVHAEPVA